MAATADFPRMAVSVGTFGGGHCFRWNAFRFWIHIRVRFGAAFVFPLAPLSPHAASTVPVLACGIRTRGFTE